MKTKYVIEINSNNRHLIIRAIETELILAKGRMEVDREHGIEPHSFTIEKIKTLNEIIGDLRSAKETIIMEDGYRMTL